jgi:hypothetical protein
MSQEINSTERNHQLMEALVNRVVNNALQRVSRLNENDGQDVVNFDDDTISFDEKIIRFFIKCIKSVDTRDISRLLTYRCHVEDYIDKFVTEFYDSQTCTWELIVCLFAAMETIVFEEACTSIRYGFHHDEIVARAFSRLIPNLIGTLSQVEDWVLLNNGWMTLLDNFDPASTQTVKIVREMSFIVYEW